MIRRGLIRRIDWGLRRLAWPTFDCADCIGMKEHGCYCSYYDAVGPCEGPGDWHLFLRWLHGFLFIWTSPFWPKLDAC